MGGVVRDLGEVGLIARLAQHLRPTRVAPRQSPWRVQVAIGDDAAVLRGDDGRLILFASDLLVEGVHFTRRTVPPRWIGWKALACNVSDIAAMGGRPSAVVVSLGLPPRTPIRFIDAMYEGLEACARRFGVVVVGGDTVRAPQVVVDVAILGAVEPRHLTLRSGARVGDVLWVTGRLGGSLRSGRHARFMPRLQEAQALVRQVKVHAMMDLSDGLASDLWQMSRASRVVLRIRRAAVPVARAAGTCLRRACWCRTRRGRQGVEHALMDGEDFELLFAVSRRDAARVPQRLGSCPVTRIGAVIGRGVAVEQEFPDGRIRPLVPTGFKHF